jgi:hypothetical protein
MRSRRVISKDDRITEATIARVGYHNSEVRAKLGEAEGLLFVCFHSEISFEEEEFIGLTLAQARKLRHERKAEYLNHNR